MVVKAEYVRAKPPPLKPDLFDFRCVVCGSPACYGVGHSIRKGTPGTWYCADHFWASPAGVDMALLMQAEANAGAETEEGEQKC